MTDPIAEPGTTDAETYSKSWSLKRRRLRKQRQLLAEWATKDLATGTVIFGLRARARQSQGRATIFLSALIVTVFVGIGYFVAYPVYIKWQATLADADRRTQLAQIGADEAGLAGTFEQLRAEAVTAALAILEEDTRPKELLAIAIANEDAALAVGRDGEIVPIAIVVSADVDRFLPQGISLYGVAFANTRRGWAVGQDGMIIATMDGGATWGEQRNPSSDDLFDVAFADAQRGWAVGQGNVILATTDGGATWVEQRPPSGFDLNAVAFVNTQRGWTVGQAGVIFATSDGGATWVEQRPPSGNDLFGIAFADEQRGWAVGRNGVIIATTDGGATWVEQRAPSGADLFGVAFADEQQGWAVGRNGVIIATMDGGATWGEQRNPTGIGLNAVAFVDARRGWAVGQDGVVIATTNGGAIWVEEEDLFARSEAPTAGTNWFGADLQRAETPQDLQRAVSLSDREIVDADYLRRLSTLLGEQASVAQRRAAVPDTTLTLEDQALETARASVGNATTPEGSRQALALFDAALRQQAYSQTWWQRLDEQIPLSVLLLFLLATLGSLYRYNTRIAGFYNARADALELMAVKRSLDQERFEALAGTLAADRVEFKAAKTPADMATEITKEVIGKLNLKPGG